MLISIDGLVGTVWYGRNQKHADTRAVKITIQATIQTPKSGNIETKSCLVFLTCIQITEELEIKTLQADPKYVIFLQMFHEY